MQWSWKKFSELTVDELYAILALRERVFIVEQNCAYLDADGMDPAATHLLQLSNGKLLGYLRVLPPHTRYEFRRKRILKNSMKGLDFYALERIISKTEFLTLKC